jgi:hypothetical protein
MEAPVSIARHREDHFVGIEHAADMNQKQTGAGDVGLPMLSTTYLGPKDS